VIAAAPAGGGPFGPCRAWPGGARWSVTFSGGSSMIGKTRLLLVGAAGASIAGLVVLRRRADAAGMDPGSYANRGLRHVVTHRFNPAVERFGLVGGRRSPWAMIEHVGRVSGTVRRTPILPRVTDATVYVPLPYGDDVQWAQNVLAAGHCRLQAHERVYDLDEPRVISARGNPTLPRWLRELDARRGRNYLALRRVADVAGTFAPSRDEEASVRSTSDLGEAEPIRPSAGPEPAGRSGSAEGGAVADAPEDREPALAGSRRSG
jgi:hypothetical protein